METVCLRSAADLAAEPDPLKRARLAEQLAIQARTLAAGYWAVRRTAVAEVVTRNDGNQAAAARELGISASKVHKALDRNGTKTP